MAAAHSGHDADRAILKSDFLQVAAYDRAAEVTFG
jgi:hypothetical protein